MGSEAVTRRKTREDDRVRSQNKTTVFLVHGCIAPWRGKSYTSRWLGQLDAHLLEKGMQVSQYEWCGRPLAALSDRRARAFLAKLRETIGLTKVPGPVDAASFPSISILAKSMGACMVERALRIAENEGQPIRCHLLRIAAPRQPSVRSAALVTELYGLRDPLAWAATVLSFCRSPGFWFKKRDKSTSRNKVVLRLRHREWNENLSIWTEEFQGDQLFDLYAKIVKNQRIPTTA